MPTIRLTIPQHMWSKEEKASAVAALTDGLTNAAQAMGKGDIKQHITVHVDETAENGYAIGGTIIA